MEAIREEIAAHGPIPFERFMELALYGPGGFFASDKLRSVAAGDFLTSPEVSPLFGATLAGFARSERDRIGEPFQVIDLGAGSGSLLSSLLVELPVEAWAIEASPAARLALAAVVPFERVLSSIADLPIPTRGVVIANELVDNLPTALAQLTASGWRERWVGTEDKKFVFVDAPTRPQVADWIDRFAGPVDVGGWVECQLAAIGWLEAILARLSAGTLLIIDYGETAENLAHRRADGTLRTYRAHHLGPHPLDEPGATDITSDVNFSALLATCEDAGWESELMRQDDFLNLWGLGDRLRDLRRQELEAAGVDQKYQLELRSRRTAGETLVHERGLGDFRVLIARPRNEGTHRPFSQKTNYTVSRYYS
ncbi:MAG TPA: SAM-dependent methyltransferase [Acidimicrobiia bacterium]|nr:SAM-dependent methyltransferase [Acidimicrobiia bacterium]